MSGSTSTSYSTVSVVEQEGWGGETCVSMKKKRFVGGRSSGYIEILRSSLSFSSKPSKHVCSVFASSLVITTSPEAEDAQFLVADLVDEGVPVLFLGIDSSLGFYAREGRLIRHSTFLILHAKERRTVVEHQSRH